MHTNPLESFFLIKLCIHAIQPSPISPAIKKAILLKTLATHASLNSMTKNHLVLYKQRPRIAREKRRKSNLNLISAVPRTLLNIRAQESAERRKRASYGIIKPPPPPPPPAMALKSARMWRDYSEKSLILINEGNQREREREARTGRRRAIAAAPADENARETHANAK